MIGNLNLGLSNRRLPTLVQTEAAECGLVCLGMIAGYHGQQTSISELRGRFSLSMKGTTLSDLIDMAEQMHMGSRPLKLELENLSELRLPCVLHWSFDHFVVLKSVRRDGVTIHDPAVGERRLGMAEVSRCFTGVALELWPNPGFDRKREAPTVSLRSIVGHVTGFHRSVGQVLLLAAAIEVFSVLNPFYVQWVVDQSMVTGDHDLLTTLALGFGFIAIVTAAIRGVRSWLLMHMSTVFAVQWKANVFTHLIRLPVQYFQKRHLGDVTSRFGSIDYIQNTVTTSFITAIVDGVMSVVMLLMMFIYSKLLGSIALISIVLYGLFRWAWYGSMQAATNSEIVLAAKQESHFLESVRGIRALKLFQGESRRKATWLTMLVDQINAGLRTKKLQIVYSSVNDVLFGIERVLIIWLGARAVMDGGFTIGALLAFRAWDDQFSSRGAALIDRIFEFRILRIHIERIGDIVHSEPERRTIDGLANTDSMDGRIRVQNLRFRYSDREPFVLDGVSFDVGSGESVAITGPSGCGKSTLAGLLVGALSPAYGEVEIGGVNSRILGVDGLRKIVGSVMQDDVLFAGSIRDNISFFDPTADFEWIQECARRAAVHDEIMNMPMRYNSLVGDMGTVLSGGQKERVLLARALYRKPKILVLDEATSQLDVAKEREVSAAIRKLRITRIIIAHRPETIASADRSLLLAKGKIAPTPRAEVPAREHATAGAPLEGYRLPQAPRILTQPNGAL